MQDRTVHLMHELIMGEHDLHFTQNSNTCKFELIARWKDYDSRGNFGTIQKEYEDTSLTGVVLLAYKDRIADVEAVSE